MVSRMECQIHCLLASLNMIPFLVEILASSRKFRNKKIKTLAFYARVECVGEELIKQKSKRLVWWPIAYNSFFFISKKKKLQIHLVLRIPSTNFYYSRTLFSNPKSQIHLKVFSC